MCLKKIHSIFPFRKLLLVLFGLAVVIQIIVISYNHLSGYYVLDGYQHFLLRLVRGTLLSLTAGLLIAYPDLYIINYLNRIAPWGERVLARIAIQFASAIIISIAISTAITLFANWLSLYTEDLHGVLMTNALIYSVVNILMIAILEGGIYFNESARSKMAVGMLQEEMKLRQNLEKEIRKRELIAKELNESREQLNSILSNLAGTAYRCYFDVNYTMKYISEKIFDIAGYHASDFIDNSVRTFASIIHPDDKDLCMDNISKATLTKTNYEFEYRILHHNGSIIWVNENGKGICDNEGNLIFLDGIITDITRRKQAEISAWESETKYKELLDFLPQPIFELNLRGEIVLSNKAGDAFFGHIPEDSNERVSALDCFVEEDLPRIIENFKKSAAGIETEPAEFTAKKKDGTLCPVMVFGNPIVRNGDVVGRRGIIIDISERKKQEVSLLRAKEDLEQINNTLEQKVTERTRELTEVNTQLLKVQKENLQSQFEVLKQQVNPHFLFNSLNVLTSLIKIDPDLAESFTERLSKVYRYVLENKDRDVVPLSTELEFLNAYLFLLEIRFMNKIVIQINIDKSFLDFQILPIAIQLLIENAIKHNTFSKINPLIIEVFIDEQHRLNIVNNLNVRETKFGSTGVGLENISRRYALVSEQKPEFTMTNDHFIARLPLLKSEKTELEKQH